MRVALLIGANPRLVKSGPVCSLDPNQKWNFVGENVINTKYEILSQSSRDNVFVHILESGSEPFISVFAESENKENGNNN